MKKKKSLLLLMLIFFALTISSSLAQEALPTGTALPQYTGVLEWLVRLGSWTLLLILIGGAGIVFAYIALGAWPQAQKVAIILGLFVIFVGIFIFQIIYIIPYLGKPVLSYTACSEAMVPIQEINIIGIPDPLVSTVVPMSCIFTGYVPSELTWLGLMTFVIFGIILPLALLIAVFYDTTDFFEHKGVRGVVTLSLSLIAFRFLLATLFLELLGFGIAGIGLVIVNFLLFQVLFRRMTKFARTVQEVRTIGAGFARGRLYELFDQMKHYESLGSDEAKKIEKQIQELIKNYPDLKADLDKLVERYKPPRKISY